MLVRFCAPGNAWDGQVANGTRKSTETRQRILDAAAKAFRRKGYVATRLAEIASLAGMRAGSIYYHFDSKEQILEEVLEIGIRRISEAVSEALAALPERASHRARIGAAATAHMTTLLRHGDYSSANMRNFSQIPAPVRRRHLKTRRQYEATWRSLLAEAQAAGELSSTADPKLLRLFLLGAINWSMEWYRPKGESIEGIAAAFTTFLFEGAGAQPARQRRAG